MERQTVLLGSIYTFHEVQGFIDKLSLSKKAKNLICSFDEGKHHFKVTFEAEEPHDAILEFCEIMRQYIEQDEYSDEEDFEGIEACEDLWLREYADTTKVTKVSLLNDAQLMSELHNMYEDVDRMAQSLAEQSASSQGTLLINHETVKESWQINHASSALMSEKSFLRDVENRTGSRLELIDSNLTIFADNKDQINTAREIILACEKVFFARSENRFNYDFHVDEGERGHFFRFRLIKSTVDYELYCNRHFFSMYLELAMTRWDPASHQFLSIEAQRKRIRPVDRSCLWSTCFYFHFGKESRFRSAIDRQSKRRLGLLQQLNKPRVDTEADRRAHIDTWVQKTQYDPAQAGSSSEESANAESETDSCPKDPMEDRRALSFGSSRDTCVQVEGFKPFLQRPKGPTMAQYGFNIPSKSTRETFNTTSTSCANEQLLIQNPQDRAAADGNAHISVLDWPNDSNFRLLENGHGKPRTANTLYPYIQEKGNLVIAQVNSSDIITSDTNAKEHRKIIEPERESQANGSQRMPEDPALKPHARPFELTDEVWKSVLNILNAPKCSAATKLSLSMKIGKIFVRSSSVPGYWRCHRARPSHVLKPEHWSDIFHTQRGRGAANTLFSSRITNHWFEAEFLIELENSNGEQFFKPPGKGFMPDQNTRLVVSCCDPRTGAAACLEIDERSNIYLARPAEAVGSVNLHFPKRSWDARIVIEERTSDGVDVPLAFTSLQKHLWVRGPKEMGDPLSPVVAGRKEAHVEITSIEFHRDVIYDSAAESFKGLKLVLTQIQRLTIKTEETAFEAYLGSEAEQQKLGLMWWTMTLQSSSLNARLRQESSHSQVGDTGNFACFPDVKLQCQKLVGLAKSVVPCMDRIGMHADFYRPSGSLGSSPYKSGSSSQAGRSVMTEGHGQSRESPNLRSSRATGLESHANIDDWAW